MVLFLTVLTRLDARVLPSTRTPPRIMGAIRCSPNTIAAIISLGASRRGAARRHAPVLAAERDGDDFVARFGGFGPISPVRAEKTVALSGQSPVIKIQYKITNLGPAPLDFIWATHPALAPTAQTILTIPARTGIVGLSSVPNLGTPGQRYSWPQIETPVGVTDMSRARSADANVFCGHYATDREADWFAV